MGVVATACPRRALLVPFAAIAIAVALVGCSKADPLVGTEFQPPRPAPTFELHNQFGLPVSLSDHKGKAVVLAFIYTQCTDICPIVSAHLRDVHRLLGGDAAEVAFMAVSVDPDRDTAEAARAYSERWGMLDKWQFLVGDESELRPVWADYFIDPTVERHDDAAAAVSHDGDPSGTQEVGPGQFTVSHSAPVFLIDRAGMLRVVFTLPFEPEDVAHDVRRLLRK